MASSIRILNVGDRVRVVYDGGALPYKRLGEKLGLEAGDTGTINSMIVRRGTPYADMAIDRNPGDVVYDVPVYILEPLTPSAEPAG
ncbi:MAG: hypothetical protein UX73_C0015G0011 [candidate division WWE3 bacterium GW2011_GWC1_47_10]|uniref:Uncharacterized protein n=1 Tax=candidate division WWE3 bacterium GW2011_GWC1_47_10 TaxID=1619122 RepID=A0A0G1R0N7_UNCKA|nr:MAG: hypothetical protein UX73_C0015G0011 [candidate division WWE3 bacterium GW2011_GWC1_47_10]